MNATIWTLSYSVRRLGTFPTLPTSGVLWAASPAILSLLPPSTFRTQSDGTIAPSKCGVWYAVVAHILLIYPKKSKQKEPTSEFYRIPVKDIILVTVNTVSVSDQHLITGKLGGRYHNMGNSWAYYLKLNLEKVRYIENPQRSL